MKNHLVKFVNRDFVADGAGNCAGISRLELSGDRILRRGTAFHKMKGIISVAIILGAESFLDLFARRKCGDLGHGFIHARG